MKPKSDPAIKIVQTLSDASRYATLMQALFRSTKLLLFIISATPQS